MKTRYSRAALTTALGGFLGLAVAGPSYAVQVNLAARAFTKTLPGGGTVPMWGFAQCNATFTSCTIGPASPGPTINVGAGQTELTIVLKNELPVPISLVIPGQAGGGNPETFIDADSRTRVKSFTTETAAGATETYTWTNPRAGTYIYQSGTLPSIQVPMGLYGALVVQGGGYPGVAWDLEAAVVYSEIDPVQNAAVDAEVTIDPLNPTYPATVDYDPQYFLVNGQAYDPAAPGNTVPLPRSNSPRTLLLRLLNAGLRSHAAAIVGLQATVRAEDGNVYPTPRTQASTLLPAGKTLDTTVTVPAGNGTYPIYDRMLDLTNANMPNGGLRAYLVVGTGSSGGGGGGGTPTFLNDTYSVAEDVTLNVPAPGVLGNDGNNISNAQVVSWPTHGTLTLNANGSFTYVPDPDYFGTDSFTYSATYQSGGGGTSGASVALTVTPVNDPPVANPDGPYVNSLGTAISVDAPGVLGNDVDVDGDALTAQLCPSLPCPTGSVALNPDGSFTYTDGTSTSFDYYVSDGAATSGPISVNIAITPPNGPILTVRGPSEELVGEYRWVLEEDTTFHPIPPTVGTNPPENTLGLNFHRSYAPVVAQGCVTASAGPDNWCVSSAELTQAVIDPLKHYFVSVLPADAGTDFGYTLGASPIPPGAASVTVHVNQAPVPLAQIHVLVFEDNNPTNGAPDGVEAGLGGFQINLEDAGGRYGATAGAMMFDAFGNPLKNYKNCGPGNPPPPDSLILTCPDGTALIKNLPPGKYGVSVVPPAGSGVTWEQTSTIEGKRVIDAWVKAGEPTFFQEFGPPGYHVFIGFVSPERVGTPTPTGPNTVTGTVTNLHMSRPPDQTLWDSNSRNALVHTTAWVGLNSAGGLGPTIAVAEADPETGDFSLSGIPDGSYQLVVWDKYLDQIIAFRNVTVSGGAGGGLGNVPVFQWFSRLEHHVFLDMNENGVRDMGEEGMPEQNVNLRFRDGSIYLGAPTDGEGYVPFDETFPFFHWQVAEVDFARHAATGVTVTVDGGGDVTSTGGVLNPQVGSPRTETGPVLTQAFQGFIGQTSVLEWGKKPYASGQNGGISGIVYYATTRAENDPRLAAGDPWEPGIPRVTVRLYREITRADGVSKGYVFIGETTTDSWDDSLPTGCPGQDPNDALVTSGNVDPFDKCYDGLRNFNQIRPGVFDGGYAFSGIPAGRYVVEVIPPSGYEIVKEEDKNVDFGDVFETAAVAMVLPGGAVVEVMPMAALVTAAMGPQPGLAQPACVGPDHVVPASLSLSAAWAAPIEAPYPAGTIRPLCSRKLVVLNDRSNGVADFHLFTAAPIAAHGTGMILDDTAQEFNPASPQFGEKWAPPFVPVSFRDYTGREINRVYSDQWGRFNALVPSTWSANEPMFSGMSPSMMISCMNDPGPAGNDPLYNPVYATFCYTLQYMPGTTTYLDTPVLPTAAFAAGFPPVDCAYPNFTPMIKRVDGTGIGPWVSAADGTQTLTIQAMGLTNVPNPAYQGPPPAPATSSTIQRNYGFGATEGSVTVGGIPLTGVTWGDLEITGTVPAGAAAGGQLVVTRNDNGRFSMNSVTVHVGGAPPVHVTAPGAPNLPQGPIQDAIDAASPGDLILVDPGTYPELVIMTKPVRLQGAGPGVTFINAAKVPTQKLQNWRDKIEAVFTAGDVDALPSQVQEGGGVEPERLTTEQGAGITVLGKNTGCDGGTPPPGCFGGVAARIDGFFISGGDSGGAIYVNGWAHGLEISNNVVTGNSGLFHGGIRVGMPFLEDPAALGGTPPFGFNQDLRIHHNQITHNGGLGGAGGGVMLCTGTDGYAVTENWICGNFTQGHGAGVGHFGLSDNGLIAFNKILFNQSFNQGQNVHGGGLLISGEPPAAGGLGLGAGSVTADANLVLGNQAGAGHGGGIRTQFVNGADPSYVVRLTNNMVVNNVAGWAGGGISLQDTLHAEIVNNTVAHNDSTATVGAAFVSPNLSLDQPAGIVSELHSPALAATLLPGSATFSNPTAFSNNIIWQNRSFHYELFAPGVGALLPALTPSAAGACDGGTPTYYDLGVLGGVGTLTPTSSILTGSSPGPQFVAEYCNGSRSSGLIAEVTTIQAAPALDEGGNWIDVRYGPITLTQVDGTTFFGNYHVAAGTDGLASGVTTDYDNQTRGGNPDIGADEQGAVPPLP